MFPSPRGPFQAWLAATYPPTLAGVLSPLTFQTESGAGWQITVSLAWLITRLPDEYQPDWRYDTFVKLLGANGQTIAQADTPSVVGAVWTVGDEIQTATRLEVPENLAPGVYKLQISLYDRTQTKNATFVERGAPTRSASVEFRIDLE